MYLSTWSTVLDPNPDIDTVLCISSEKSHRPIYKHTLWNDSFSKIDIKIDFAIGIIPHLLFYAHM